VAQAAAVQAELLQVLETQMVRTEQQILAVAVAVQ
jgi:hypothetical protein